MIDQNHNLYQVQKYRLDPDQDIFLERMIKHHSTLIDFFFQSFLQIL